MPEGHADRWIVVHGHFYQPPRENPWIEEVELQDSAAPFHDWNARIAAECYGPNSAARMVGGHGGVIDIVNNYAKISFNVGPTLMSWLEAHVPGTYRKILEADRLSAAARGGHGNAIAQAYNHAILPLAGVRDRITQIRWGIADFRRRFGRAPRGMWLPEAAVDEDTLVRLVDEGIEFTVLAPGQARRFRASGASAWRDGIDPRRPYRAALPGGREITLFFYDGAVAHDIAFGDVLRDRDTLVNRLIGAFGDVRAEPGPWLVNIATDGETFGHHRAFGDMVLAAAIERIERERPARLTNYAHFLSLAPPTHEVELVTPSSWSCAHGVRRWTDDCGCTTGAQPGWHQRWRRPLREALDSLRDRLEGVFEARGRRLLSDPWAARDAYVDVVLDRSAETVDAFLDRWAARPLEPHERSEALRLLEMQRHAMLMYTSCGWFFGELSGPEGVQVLKYAARAIQLAREVDGTNLEPTFQAMLVRAPSNLLDQGDGARILEHRVRPSVVNLGGVVAHFAIASLFGSYPPEGRIFCYRYQADELVRRSRGTTTLALGHVRLASEITREATHATFAVLHFGGHDLRCSIGLFADVPTYEELRTELLGLFDDRSVGDVVRAIDRRFGGREYGLSDLFLDERRRIVNALVGEVMERHRPVLLDVSEQHRPLVRFLVASDTPVPAPLRAATDWTVSARFHALLEEASVEDPRFEVACAELAALLTEARALGAAIDLGDAERVIEARLLDQARVLAEAPRRATARAMLAYLDLAERLGLRPSLWEVQNLYWTLTHGGPRGPDADPELLVRLGTRLGFDAASITRAWAGSAVTHEERVVG